MKRYLTLLIFILFPFWLTAQTDYLEPVRSFSTYTGELGEYYRNVFPLLETGFQRRPYARLVVIPSFTPEYAMSVERRQGRYCLVSNTLSRTYWQSDKNSVKVNSKTTFIKQELYTTLGSIFRQVTTEVQDLDGTAAGLDGIVYYFYSTDARGNIIKGKKWSPDEGSLMERLVTVCQSAYQLSIGKNISEASLTEEAAALLKDLRQRAKEQPEAYKKPLYVGIYQVGAQLKTLSGKTIDSIPELSSGTTDQYLDEHLQYPAKLLKEKVEGYALCEFTIDKGGTVLRPHILQATHPEFAAEALRLVKEMPKWKPAVADGNPIGTNYTLYVPFRIKAYQKALQKHKE